MSPIEVDNAEKLLLFAGKQGIATFPLDVHAVAAALKIQITSQPLDDNVSGNTEFNIPSKVWEMTVNSNHHPNRQRYTITHELAHYCLHRHLVREFKDHVFFRKASDEIEWQANKFAGQILMPEDEVRRLLREGVTSVDDLATRCNVSTLALRVRAQQLGLTGHGL